MNIQEYLSRDYPFNGMKISEKDDLKKVKERSPCSKCHKSRKYFCYSCYIPVDDLTGKLPNIKVGESFL